MSDNERVISLNIFSKQFSSISLITITYYRIIGITFGGIKVDKFNGRFITNCFLKIYGILIGIGLLAMSLFATCMYTKLPEISELSQSEIRNIYYLLNIWLVLFNIFHAINIFNMNRNGIKLYTIVEKYPIKSKTNLILYFTLWFGHIIAAIFVVIWDLLSDKRNHYLLYFWNFINKLYQMPLMWSTPFLTWAISLGKLCNVYNIKFFFGFLMYSCSNHKTVTFLRYIL